MEWGIKKDGKIFLWIGMAIFAATILEAAGVWEWVARAIIGQ